MGTSEFDETQFSMVGIRSSQNSDWISLREVLLRLSQTAGEAEALPQFLSRLSGAELEGRAAVTIQEADIGPIYCGHVGLNYEPKTFEGMRSEVWLRKCDSIEPYIAVGNTFFARAHRWKIDVTNIDIDQGMITARRLDWFFIKSGHRRKLPEWDCDYEDEPSLVNEGSIRRVAIGLEFLASDFPEVPLPLAVEPHDTLAAESNESQEAIISNPAKAGVNALRANDSRVMAYFRDLISTGEFRERFGDPEHPGLRAVLIEAYQQELTNRNEDHERSRSTLGRRVNKLLTLYKNTYEKKI